jgi:NAD(P)-dependent dehydrogenase (short-subunit alcohol dehydrogenase family)
MPNDRRVVVSGANSELGKTLISYLVSNGVSVFATTRTHVSVAPADSAGLRVADEIDLIDASALARLKAEVSGWSTGPFSVVHCVGHFPGFGPIHRLDPVSARRTYDSNLVTTYNLASTLAPMMAAQGGGHFVTFSSHAIPPAFPLMAAFLSAKAGVEFLSRAIANEFGRYNVRATTLALGTVDTPQERALIPNGESREWLTPKEVAEYVGGLLTEETDIANGNVLHLYKYSDSYTLQTYLDRIGRRNEWPVSL